MPQNKQSPPPPPPPSPPQPVQHQVVVSLTASGDVSDYAPGSPAADRIRSKISQAAGVSPSDVTLVVTSASVNIDIIIQVATANAAQSLSTNVGNALDSKSAASSLLGIPVESAPTVVAQATFVEPPLESSLQPSPQPSPAAGDDDDDLYPSPFDDSPMGHTHHPSGSSHYHTPHDHTPVGKGHGTPPKDNSYSGYSSYSYGGRYSAPPSPPVDTLRTEVAIKLGVSSINGLRGMMLKGLAESLQMQPWDLTITRVFSSKASLTVLVRLTEHFAPACDSEEVIEAVNECTPVRLMLARLIATQACSSPPPMPPPPAITASEYWKPSGEGSYPNTFGPSAEEDEPSFAAYTYDSIAASPSPGPMDYLMGYEDYASPGPVPVPPPGWKGMMSPGWNGGSAAVGPPLPPGYKQSPEPVPPPVLPPGAPPPPATPGSACADPTIARCVELADFGHCLPLALHLANASQLPLATEGPQRLVSMPLDALSSALSASAGVSLSVLNVSIPCGDGFCAAYERLPRDWDPSVPSSVCYADCGCGGEPPCT